MAGGFAQGLERGNIEPYSAGLIDSRVHSGTVAVMKEIGIDISHQQSKQTERDLLNQMDVVIALCGHAGASCPVTPLHIGRLHWPVDDPAGTIETEKELISAFRKARNEIKKRIINFIEEVGDAQKIS